MKKHFLSHRVEFVILLGPTILFLPLLLQGEAIYWGTPSLQFIPWWKFAWQSILSSEVPLWNPYNGMGAPLLANYQSGLFYPPNWLLFFFYLFGGTEWMAWGTSVLLAGHLSFGGIGFARLVKRNGLSELAEIICGISFSLCGYFVARTSFFPMLWVGAWFPWIIYFASGIASPFQINKSPGLNEYIGIIATITMMLLAGHAQLCWYILIYCGAWIAVGSFNKKSDVLALLKNISRFGILSILAALISAVQLISTAEYLLNSQRSASVAYEIAIQYSFWPWRLVTLIMPGFFGNPGNGDFWGYASYWEDAIYIGILPMILAITAIVHTFFKRDKVSYLKPTIFLISFCFISIGMALGNNTPVFPFLYSHIPTFNLFQAPARYLIWLEFSLILLAGIGASLWKRPTGKALYWTRLLTAGGAAVTIGAFLSLYLIKNVELTFIKATSIAGLWFVLAGLFSLTKPLDDEKNKSQMQGWSSLIVLFLLTDLLSASWTLIPGIRKDFYKTIPNNTAAFEAGRVFISQDAEYQMKFRRFFRFESFLPIENPEALRNTFLPNLNLLDGVYSVNNFDPFVLNRYAIWMEKLEEIPDDVQSIWLQKMNVQYEIRLSTDTTAGFTTDTIENGGRIDWVACPTFVDNEKSALELLENGDISIGGAVIETKNKVACHTPATEPIINTLVDDANQVQIAISTEADGWLVLRDTWFPGWMASIDEKPTEIFHADYLFRGVYVPAGSHVLNFAYRPKSFYIGLFITLVSLISVIILGAKLKRKRLQ